jgi:hydrogenase maturation protease
MKEIILGLGNPLLGDDSVGLRVARQLSIILKSQDLTIEEVSSGGLDILNLIADFEIATIIDAVQTSGGSAGTIYNFGIDEVIPSQIRNTHQLDFVSAIRLVKELGLKMPNTIRVYAVEAPEIYEIRDKCSPMVDSAIIPCAEMIALNYTERNRIENVRIEHKGGVRDGE